MRPGTSSWTPVRERRDGGFEQRLGTLQAVPGCIMKFAEIRNRKVRNPNQKVCVHVCLQTAF